MKPQKPAKGFSVDDRVQGGYQKGFILEYSLRVLFFFLEEFWT